MTGLALLSIHKDRQFDREQLWMALLPAVIADLISCFSISKICKRDYFTKAKDLKWILYDKQLFCPWPYSSGSQTVVRAPLVVREGLQGGTQIGLLLSVHLHKNIFIAMFAVIKMTQRRFRSSFIHEHGSCFGALRFMSVARASVRFHTFIC